MNTMEMTKLFGALCGSLLIFLLIRTAADTLYYGGSDAAAYVIEVEEPDVADPAEPAEDIDFEALVAAADAGAGATVWRRCAACHTVEDGENRVGPHLHAVVGRDIASVAGFNYSAALAGIDGDWSYERLYEFLRNPREWAPGTTMNFAGLANSAERANVIAYLEEHRD